MPDTIATPEPSRRTRRPALTRLLAVVVALASIALVTGCTPEQAETFKLINTTRGQHGLKHLSWHPQLGTKAQAWAEHLSRQGKLSHSTLAQGAPAGWKRLGENVGYGGSIAQIHGAYLNSPGHRANILNSTFTHAGTGVAKAGGRVYTVHVFMRA